MVTRTENRYAIDDCKVDVEVDYQSGRVKIYIFDPDSHIIGCFDSTTEAWKAKTIIEKLFEILKVDTGEMGTLTLKQIQELEEKQKQAKEVIH